MSLVAKVFIVINQILSLALIFLMATLLVHKGDYKKKATLERQATDGKVAERNAREADFGVQVEGLSEKISMMDRTTNETIQGIDNVKDMLKVSQNTEDILAKEIAQLESQLETLKGVNRDAAARKSALERQISTSMGKLGTAKKHEQEWTGKLQEEEGKVRSARARLNQ